MTTAIASTENTPFEGASPDFRSPTALCAGFENHSGPVHRNLSAAELYEHALARGEAVVAADGPLLAVTGEHTGRTPNDRFVVQHPGSEEIWWGSVNRPFKPEAFDDLLSSAASLMANRDLFVFEGYAGADPDQRLRVRVITQFAWHNLFAQNMFVRPASAQELVGFEPDFTVVDIPDAIADPETHGTNSGTFVLLDLERRMALIGGTQYAGEIKKSVFAVMNYHLPRKGILSMHCSANYGESRDDSALFFGLSGTGKTTLSADPSRTLIGDDEHAWDGDGIFNIEGGCYAKVIRLDPQGEPEIFGTTQRFGTVLENVVCDPSTRTLDLDDDSLTENTRSSYPLTHLSNVDVEGQAGHPKNVVFLTCDAFGVLPPIARLNPEQAMYHFLSGYTAKVAGTERGVTEPQATFSACFGAPFLPLPPSIYARLLGEKLERHNAKVWLVNTGWTGGAFGEGKRMALADTRRMVNAALSGELDNAESRQDPIFGFSVPLAVEGVDSSVLDPRGTWADTAAYDKQVARLAEMFQTNAESFEMDDAVRSAGPKLS